MRGREVDVVDASGFSVVSLMSSARLENPVGSVTSVKNFQRSAEVTEVAEVVWKCTVVGFLIQQVFISQWLVWWATQ